MSDGTEVTSQAKKLCKNLTVWKIPSTQMDGEEVDYAAGVAGEVSAIVYSTVQSN